MKLGADEYKKVASAFSAAQARTRAPLVGVLAGASSDYAAMPLALSGGLALAAPWPLLAFTALSAERVFLIQLLVGLGALALLTLTPLHIMLTPRLTRRAHAHRAALVQFSARGLDDASERTGVLLYVSLAERHARVISGDVATHAVGVAKWQGVIDALVADLRAGPRAEALCNAAARCADLLAPEFPPDPAGKPPRGARFHVV
jgi:putative membrane protein